MVDKSFGIDAFECAPGLRLAAHERVSQIHHDNLNRRLDRMEEVMERMEKRMWLAAYGIAGALLAQGIQSFMAITP